MDHVQKVLDSFKGVTPEGDGWEAFCPAHGDDRRSLSIGLGAEGRVLLKCFAGCATLNVCREAGLKLSDLFAPDSRKKRSPVVKRYDYTDVDGNLLFQVERTEAKDFFQRQPDGNGGWKYGIKGVPRVLYRLPEVAKAADDVTIYIPEGEKDVDNLVELGLVATCNPGGANKWEYLSDDSYLAKHPIVIIPDEGEPGAMHAADIARRLYGRASEIRIVDPPEGYKDVSAWIEARDSLTADELREALEELAASTKPYEPSKQPPKQSTEQSSKHPVAGGDTVPLGQIDPESKRLVLSPRKTLPTAEAFIREFYTHPEGQTLHEYAGTLMRWRNNHYQDVEDQTLQKQLQSWLHEALRYVVNRRTGQPELTDFESNPGTVKSALESIRTSVHLPLEQPPPCWLDEVGKLPPASEMLPCRSNLLHLPTLESYPSTPRLFVTNALEFDYDPRAETPNRWLEFLDQVLPGDPGAIALLQSWFGYALTADTSRQKMMLLIGPKRSGKGTIARVLAKLLGTGNVCGPTTSSLGSQFGLQPLIGKSLAIISDARFGGENIGAVVERLLCVSGEDTLTIDRKYLGAVTMNLPTRFMFLTNEMPKLSESSGALAGRFLVLRFTESFYGREDCTLTDQLIDELPGILNWAIAGWHTLRSNGRFIEPESTREAAEDLEDLLSPIGTFIRECCITGADFRTPVRDLYSTWRSWCESNGRDYPGTIQNFSRDLLAAVPNAKTRRNHSEGRFVMGVALK